MFPETAPVMPDDRIAHLPKAEAEGGALGLLPVRLASVVGQARAYLWLGNYDPASALAGLVPRGFTYRAEYSGNNPDQYDGIYSFTWGDPESICWTIGDGTAASSGGALGAPGGISGAGVSSKPARRLHCSFQRGVPTLGADPLSPIVLSGDPMADLRAVVDERARELWLTGNRHSTARRLRRDLATDIDLFPTKTPAGGGDDIALPISQIELDNNLSLRAGNACPAGQFPGSWR